MDEKARQQVREAIGDHELAHPHWRQEARESREREDREAEERARRARDAPNKSGSNSASKSRRTIRRRGATG